MYPESKLSARSQSSSPLGGGGGGAVLVTTTEFTHKKESICRTSKNAIQIPFPVSNVSCLSTAAQWSTSIAYRQHERHRGVRTEDREKSEPFLLLIMTPVWLSLLCRFTPGMIFTFLIRTAFLTGLLHPFLLTPGKGTDTLGSFHSIH